MEVRMSRKNEIKTLLLLHTKELTDRGLDFVATEIEKLLKNDTQKVFQDVVDWQYKQFPTASTESKLKHLQFEIFELLHKPNDPLEYADAIMLLVGAADNAGINFKNIVIAVGKKLKINKKRKWGKPNKDGFTEHIKPEVK